MSIRLRRHPPVVRVPSAPGGPARHLQTPQGCNSSVPSLRVQGRWRQVPDGHCGLTCATAASTSLSFLRFGLCLPSHPLLLSVFSIAAGFDTICCISFQSPASWINCRLWRYLEWWTGALVANLVGGLRDDCRCLWPVWSAAAYWQNFDCMVDTQYLLWLPLHSQKRRTQWRIFGNDHMLACSTENCSLWFRLRTG